jgi:hypothetical protein
MKTLRRSVGFLGTTAVLLAASVEKADAQGAAGTAAPLPSNVVKQSRPYYVEGAAVVGLMAASIFAVCRSSRRV